MSIIGVSCMHFLTSVLSAQSQISPPPFLPFLEVWYFQVTKTSELFPAFYLCKAFIFKMPLLPLEAGRALEASVLSH